MRGLAAIDDLAQRQLALARPEELDPEVVDRDDGVVHQISLRTARSSLRKTHRPNTSQKTDTTIDRMMAFQLGVACTKPMR